MEEDYLTSHRRVGSGHHTGKAGDTNLLPLLIQEKQIGPHWKEGDTGFYTGSKTATD